MPPKRVAETTPVEGKTAGNKKTKSVEVVVPALSEEEIELAQQVVSIFQAFLKVSLNWTGGDDDLEFKRSKLSLVKGKSFTDSDPDREDELLVITLKEESSEQFTEEFLLKIRPNVIEIINSIVKANNTWLEATNYHEGHLTQDDVEAMLKLFIDPEVTDDMNAEDDEQGIRNGAIGFRRASGNAIGRWDYTECCPDDIIDSYKDNAKGAGKILALVE